MAEFDAIILAAGLSRRMGRQNKLLLDVAGAPIITRVVRAYIGALGHGVTVVTGHEADQVEAALANLPVTFLRNPDYETGQQSSVVAGLRQKSTAKATLLGLGDQPLLTADDLCWLMAAHQAGPPDKIKIPARNGTRGNPIVIPATLRPEMLANPKQAGCRRFTRDNPDQVQMVEPDTPGFFTDIDTIPDYDALRSTVGGHHALTS